MKKIFLQVCKIAFSSCGEKTSANLIVRIEKELGVKKLINEESFRNLPSVSFILPEPDVRIKPGCPANVSGKDLPLDK